MLELDPATKAVIESAVVITGGGRSGTTILGKLIHTFRNVEYAFEPPMLVALFALLDQLPEPTWKFLYEAYLAEEFLSNALAGRTINTNRVDDSSIHAVKSEVEIEERLSRSWSKQEIMEKVETRRCFTSCPTSSLSCSSSCLTILMRASSRSSAPQSTVSIRCS